MNSNKIKEFLCPVHGHNKKKIQSIVLYNNDGYPDM